MGALARRAEKSLCETAAHALCLSEQRQRRATALFCKDLRGRIPRQYWQRYIKECRLTQNKQALCCSASVVV